MTSALTEPAVPRASAAPVRAAAPASLRKLLLVCGILSSLLYVSVDIFAANQWEGYSYVSQAFSELTAIEAPTRPLMVVANAIPYTLLVLAFAAGVWASAGRQRALRVTAGLLVLYAIAGFLGGVVFPMHSRGTQPTMTFTDTMHLAFTTVGVLATLLVIGFGGAAFGRRFRLFSSGTILLLVLGGGLAYLDGARLAAGLPTPWFGLTERLNIYGTMLWVAILAAALLRVQVERPRDGRGEPQPESGEVRGASPRRAWS